MTTPEDPNQPPAGQTPPEQTPPPPPYAPPPPPYAPPPAAPPPYGQGPYGQPPVGQPQYGQPQPQYGAPPPGYPGQTPYTGQLYFGGHSPAPWFERVVATLIDDVIVIIPAIIIGVAAGSRVAYQLIAIIGGLAMGYLNGAQGQTPGKRVMKLKVLKEQDGQVIGGGMGIVRGIAHILDALPCFIGYFWPLWDDKKQTFADKIIGTVVIKL